MPLVCIEANLAAVLPKAGADRQFHAPNTSAVYVGESRIDYSHKRTHNCV